MHNVVVAHSLITLTLHMNNEYCGATKKGQVHRIAVLFNILQQQQQQHFRQTGSISIATLISTSTRGYGPLSILLLLSSSSIHCINTSTHLNDRPFAFNGTEMENMHSDSFDLGPL